MAISLSGFKAAILALKPKPQPAPISIAPQGPVKALAAEAVAPQLFSLTSGDGEDAGFRRITSLPTLRDLNPMMHDRMQQVCYYLRVTTPYGKRIVEIITDYSVGDGVRVTCKDPKVQDVVDKFWNDEINKIDQQIPIWCDELTTFGEICLPFSERKTDGFVRMGYVDPMNIDGIRFAEMDTSQGTATLSFPWGVQLRREIGEVSTKVLPIVRTCEDVNDPAFGTLQGECFYHTINKAKSASRGFSELFNLADWIDVFDQMMFDFADKVRLTNAMVWHYVLTGGDEKSVNQFKDNLTKNPPKQGGVYVTNEKVSMEPKTPEFHGADMTEIAGALKKYGMGGAGLPGTFFADGDDANKASALEMNAPAVKKFKGRQKNMNELLTGILNYVIDRAVQTGVLPKTIERGFTLDFPEIAVKDLQKGAAVLQGIATALLTGQQEGWVTKATAARAFHNILGEIGCDIPDSQEEFDQAQQELEDQKKKDQNSLGDQTKLAAALAKLQLGDGVDPNAPKPAGSATLDDTGEGLQDAA